MNFFLFSHISEANSDFHKEMVIEKAIVQIVL